MTIERRPVNRHEAVRLYVEEGLSARAIGKELGVSHTAINAALKKAGVVLRDKRASIRGTFARKTDLRRFDLRWTPPEGVDIPARYMAGESLKDIADSLGVSTMPILRILMEAGVQRRSAAEQLRLRYQRMTPGERRSIASPMFIARRGSRASAYERANHSLAVREGMYFVGRGEKILGAVLSECGYNPEPQFPIDGYNLDFAIGTIAVELYRGSQYPFHSPAGQLAKVEYLLNRGFDVYYVWVNKGTPLSEAIAEDFIAFAERASRNPTPVREYRVVRGCGEVVTAGRGQLDDLARVSPPRHRAHHPHRANARLSGEAMIRIEV